MAKLVYTMLASLDGYVADERGEFGWAEPDEEVHRFANGLERPVGTYLFGRRMFEVMAVWDDPDALAGEPDYIREFGELWRAADKIVYSTTLAEVRTRRTSLRRSFDPEAVRRLKETAAQDIAIGGPDLAGQALRAGLVDELRILAAPVVIGGGTAWLPDHLLLRLDLLEERRFTGGFVYLRYRIAPEQSLDGSRAQVRSAARSTRPAA
jgi:dihydrofolate reductase